LQAIEHIREYYAGLVPEAVDYFPAPGRKQAVNTLLDTGEHRSLWRATLTIAATVGIVNTLVTGAAVAFALGDLGLHVALAVTCGIVVAALVGWALMRHQSRRFVAVVGEDND
jgi:hypothetical protein